MHTNSRFIVIAEPLARSHRTAVPRPLRNKTVMYDNDAVLHHLFLRLPPWDRSDEQELTGTSHGKGLLESHESLLDVRTPVFDLRMKAASRPDKAACLTEAHDLGRVGELAKTVAVVGEDFDNLGQQCSAHEGLAGECHVHQV